MKQSKRVKKVKMLCFFLFLFAALPVIGCVDPSQPTPSVTPEEYDRPPQSPRSPVTGLLPEPERSWSAISVKDDAGRELPLSLEDAQHVHRILSSMEAEEILTPYHYEGQASNCKFEITVFYDYDHTVFESIASTETGNYYYRYTDTVGDHGDRGYVGGRSDGLFDFLTALFS